MKAAVFNEAGGSDKIQITEVSKPELKPNQILIQVKACALNHFDLFVLNEYDSENITSPFWGGADIAGVVVEIGSSTNSLVLGDRVVVNPSIYCGHCEHCIAGEESQCHEYGIIGDSIQGGLAEYISIDAAKLLKMHEHMSFSDVAATPLVYQTDWRALINKANISRKNQVKKIEPFTLRI
jgi:D-arabinose 1-dehydrogenase-like Zn-dependent alcohol dehydrogenase